MTVNDAGMHSTLKLRMERSESAENSLPLAGPPPPPDGGITVHV